MEINEAIKKECLRRGYSIRTIKSYSECINYFFRYCGKEYKKVCNRDIENYIDWLIDKGASKSTINLNINSIKFFYQQILGRRLFLRIKSCKKPKRIAEFLTEKEVLLLIDSINNPKHRLMIQLLYSAGLRLSELINLKVKDIEFFAGYGWVRNGKGNKDRQFVLAEMVKKELSSYIRENNIRYDSYIFLGRNGKLSHRTVQEIVKKAAKRAGIKKDVHPHTFRHSFATHLINNKYDTTIVQRLLGHSRHETTMGYVHANVPILFNVKSPLDSIGPA